MTTPQKSKQLGSSPRFSSPEKYHLSRMVPDLSEYVKQKKRTLPKYIAKNTSNVQGEVRGAYEILSSNVVYKGEWKDDEPHGLGELYFPDGSYYEGTFAHGFAHGDGRYIFSKGNYYEGQVRHNAAEGKGTLVNEQGEGYSYTGEWSNDVPNGQGE